MNRYTVEKSESNNLWWVLDADGYEVSYVGYEFKKDAVEAARIKAAEDKAIKHNADHVDGYDRDDLGESQDY